MNQARKKWSEGKVFWAFLSGALLASHPSAALNARGYAVLRKLDPDTRLEQICDIEAMARIKSIGHFAPDRAKSDVSLHPEHLGETLRAKGAAFRSNGHWYSLSFECQATPDHMKVISFTFEIGPIINPSRWADLGLWK